MCTANCEGFFMVHHQLKFSSVLAINLCVHTQYTSLSTALYIFLNFFLSGCPLSGKKSGKNYFFKVRELSGNFEICQGILK